MTAHAMKGDEDRCLGAGMDAYLTKPINPSRLFDLIRSLKGNAAGAGSLSDDAQAAISSPILVPAARPVSE